MRSGFTLLHLAVLLAVAAVMLAASLPGGDKARTDTKQRNFIRQAEIFEAKQKAEMAESGRRFCPSDITLSENDTDYGLELPHGPNCAAGINTSDCCMGGGAGTYYGPMSGVVAGGVPVVSMGLPKSAALGPTKNRILYAITQAATAKAACTTPGALKPSVIVKNSAGGRVLGVHVGAYIEFGEDAQGATPAAGGAVRKDTGNLDADTLENAGLSASRADQFNNVFINRNHDAAFDDAAVGIDECCKGMGCNP
jgi:type II secretory pathway pseudopilin PulG